MIVITDVKYFKVEGDTLKVIKQAQAGKYNAVVCSNYDRSSVMGVNEAIEILRGRKLRRLGEEVVLGIDNEICDLLDWHQEAWDALCYMTRETNALSDQLELIKKANFLKRLKWLFCGVNP